ncbi:MAG: hypothetical protein OEV64_07960 [Desulfobulbaceae bacterium]|nr:hypothetical protein [Desulfobulbaceae bacterium]
MSWEERANIVLCIFLGILVIFILSAMISPVGEQNHTEHEAQSFSAPSVVSEKVLLSEQKLVRGPNNVVKAHFMVRNNSGRAINNITFQCVFYSDIGNEYGLEVDRERWVFAGLLRDGGSMNYERADKHFINRQARSHTCVIEEIGYARPPVIELLGAEGDYSGLPGEQGIFSGRGAHEDEHGWHGGSVNKF